MAQQKLVCRTIMKTDIKGYSNLIRLLSDLEFSNLLNEHKKFIKENIIKYDGKIIKGEGDAFWITFESATHAVQSAIEIQNKLRNDGVGKKDNEKLSIRISITLGDVIEQDKDIFGEAVNLCARIENITPADEIYLSNSTFLSLRKQNINTAYIGEYSFKGFENKEKVYKIFLKHNTHIINDVYIWFSDLENFSQVQDDIEFTEIIYDKYDMIIQEAVKKYDGKVLNIMADGFLITFNSGDNMFKASQNILKQWDKFIKNIKSNIYIRIGVHKGTIRNYRTLVCGNDFNVAAKLESASRNFEVKRRNILAITKEAYKGIKNKKIKNQLVIIPNNKLNKKNTIRQKLIDTYKSIYIYHT